MHPGRVVAASVTDASATSSLAETHPLIFRTPDNQALDRTAPMLPVMPGLAARRTHDYKRHGTTTLFAALEVATRKITADACYPRHRHQEFLRFLKKVAAAHPGVRLHVVLDNYGTRKHPEIRKWLAKPENERVTLHFTPTGCSWMNMVEIFFGIITARPSAAAPSPPSTTSPPPSVPSSTPTTTGAAPSNGPKTPTT
jgi:transposase